MTLNLFFNFFYHLLRVVSHEFGAWVIFHSIFTKVFIFCVTLFSMRSEHCLVLMVRGLILQLLDLLPSGESSMLSEIITTK